MGKYLMMRTEHINSFSVKYYRLKEVNGEYLCIQEEVFQNGSRDFTGNWKIIGFKKIRAFGHLGYTLSVKDILKLVEVSGSEALKFNNGKGKYVVEDYDYGTRRIWGMERLTALWVTNEEF